MVIYLCRAGQTIHLRLIQNPDRFADTGDETTIWEVQGDASSPGVLRIVVGERPPNLVEKVPLADRLNQDLAYEVTYSWDGRSNGFRFTPSALPKNRIAYADMEFTQKRFEESGRNACEEK